MAITKLSTNYKDDIINTSVNAHRRYLMTAVSGQTDTYELEETTTFIQKGTDYGADDVNGTNTAVNSVIDLAEANAEDINGLQSGTIAIARANTATSADSATTASSATTAGSADNDFILCNQQALTFSNGYCQLNDTRITAGSIADVYFTDATINTAESAGITVQTYASYMRLYASQTPTGAIVATIRIRVV